MSKLIEKIENYLNEIKTSVSKVTLEPEVKGDLVLIHIRTGMKKINYRDEGKIKKSFNRIVGDEKYDGALQGGGGGVFVSAWTDTSKEDALKKVSDAFKKMGIDVEIIK